MEIRFQNSPGETAGMHTHDLRKNFLFENMMQDDKAQLLYSHYDRMIVGGVKPVSKIVELPNHPELKADFFLERRELGIINVGGNGTITADGRTYELDKLDCLYLGKGVKDVQFKSSDAKKPAVFYLLSAQAHLNHPTHLMKKEEVDPVSLGEMKTANRRTIFKYIHADGIQSCQLVMGLTVLQEGSVWNTMPAHTHTRRMEVYFYYDVPEGQTVVHFMGQPQETRHIFMKNHEAVVSPPWSIHAGSGTSSYSFIWGMAGENYTYTDMDVVAIPDLK